VARLGGRRIVGREPRDDLFSCRQPFQLVPGIGGLLAQQLGLTGQPGRARWCVPSAPSRTSEVFPSATRFASAGPGG
jgi:hypothetical protein